MRRLINWFNILIKKRKELKRWQRIVTLLAAVITFFTTYALILPAITVEKDSTGEVAGMYLEETADRDEMLEEDAFDPEGVSIAADMDDAATGENEDVETDAEIPEYDEEIEVALPVETLKASGSDYIVTLSYDESSGIPEGAVLDVSEIAQNSNEYQTYLEEAKKAMGLTEEEALPSFAARFFDIKIMVDEQEFTPDSGVSVEITYTEPLAEHPDTEVNAVHFVDETAEAEVIEANTAEIQEDGQATVEFTAESFSVYGVIYTVDFHWEVDGRTYDFSIPGGGFVSFEHLVEVLGLGENITESEIESEDKSADSSDADNTGSTVDSKISEDGITTYDEAIKLNEVIVSEKTKRFVADVEDVKFSSPELVWVGKIDTASEVGSLKEANKLEVDYSACLTEEQIEEINAQKVEAGDWALISIHPFTTDETLTVTMKNGEQFVVKVTDAQISTHVITADGKDYIITVTYGPEAEIPDGAELRAREILAGTAKYDEYYQDAWEAIQPEFKDNDKLNAESVAPIEKRLMAEMVTPEYDIDFMRLFDISIVNEGKEIEPTAPVKVTISYVNAVEVDNTKEATVVHFVGDTKAEVLDVQTEKDARSEDAPENSILSENNDKSTTANEIRTFEFTQASFSVTATIVKENNSVLPDGSYVILMHDNNWYALNSNGGATPTSNFGNEDSYDLDESLVWTIKRNNNGTYTIKNGNKYLVLNGNNVTGNSATGITVSLSTSGNYQRVGFRNGSTVLEWNRDGNYFYTYSGQDQNPQVYYLARAAVDNIEVTATRRDEQLHYIITDHYGEADKDHTSNTSTRAEGFLSPGASISFDSDASASSVYAGVTVTAGHDAVSIGQNGHVTITNNDKDIHVVHIDYYYNDPQITVSTTTFNRAQDKYDTKIVGNTKYYDLNDERIHTDKTATAVSGGDGRSFDITLDAWNVGWNISTVGMVLDASGSMAWDSAPGHKLSVSGNYTPYKFLSPSEVNKILCIDYSDYSVAGYGDYTYFVYEQGNNVNEYAPLGYFKGNATGNENGGNRYAYVDAAGSTKFAHLSNYNGAGWYYVNTTDASHFNYIGGAKQYLGINTNDRSIDSALGTAGTYQTVNFYQGKAISDWCVNGDTRYRQTSDYNNARGNTPPQFYIDDKGFLRCFFYHSKTIRDSYVFAKQDTEIIKTELLQDAIGCFAGTLHSISPTSAIGMTRFSRANNTATNGFDTDKLTLLNWTTDTESIIGALNLSYGGQNMGTGTTTDNGLTVYNYGLTGNTSTQSGLSAFNTYLDGNNALNAWARQYAKNTGTAWNPKYEFDKYVIVFTDGKDTDQDNDTYKYYAKNQADALKSQGYTVITVLLVPAEDMNAAGEITDPAFQQAEAFLDTLNGNQDPNKNTWADEVFIANAADPNALRGHFVQIAEKIAKTLENYTIRDYIDPRFQLVDENDNPISLGEHPELGFTLYYDSERDMQYVEWTEQKIPTNLKQDSAATADGKPVDMSLWSQTIRVRAKDDFLGGNEVLSNANVEELNKVYPDGQPNSTDPVLSRTFPRTTVDPQVLDLELGLTEDTIFLGERIDATEHNKLESEIGDTVDSSWYYEYLERYGVVTNTDYISQIQQGTAVTVPYYYFPDDTTKATFDAARLNPSNQDAYMKDQIGTLTYQWVPCDADGNEISMTDPFNHLTTNTDDVHYRLKIKYTPFNEEARESYVNSMIDPDSKDRPVKEPVGVEQTGKESQKDEGIATVHIVSGQLTVSKQVLKEDILKYLQRHDSAVFTFTLTKTGTPNSVYPDLETDYKTGHGGYTYPASISVSVTAAAVNAAEVVNGYVTIAGTTVEKLPKGSYVIQENSPSDSSFEFESIGHLAVDANYRAEVEDRSSKVNFEIGELASDAAVTNPVLSGKPYLNAQRVSVYARNAVNLLSPLSIKKVDIGNTNILLGNAVFSLYGSDAVDANGKLKTNATAIKTGITTDSEDDLGFADLGELEAGTYYLVETNAPAGYVLPDYEYVRITIDSGVVRYQMGATGEPRTAAMITRNEEDVYLLEVYNSAGFTLPSTGGPGTTLIYFLGIMLTCLAGAGLVMRKRIITQ